MPAPTGYVTDMAGVLSQQTKQQLEELCTEVDQQAHAQIAVVTIQTLEDEPAEQFANELFAKWKVGAKGTDRGILLLFSIQDRKRWIEVGYGLEGILNDAKVGDIGRDMVPMLRAGDYDGAVTDGVQRVAQVIAADAKVTLAQPMPQYQQERRVSGAQMAGGIVRIVIFAVILIFILSHSGPRGLLWFLLGNALGGGWSGGSRSDSGGGSWGGGGGGGFGGFGGGGSGGGGAGGGW